MSSAGGVQPGKLWSLFDMLRAYVSEFFFIAQLIAEMEKGGGISNPDVVKALDISSGATLEARLAPIWEKIISRDEDDSKTIVLKLPMSMPSVEAQVQRVWRAIGSFTPPMSSNQLSEILGLVTDLRNRIQDELPAHKMYYVRPELVRYYEDKDQFGNRVTERFPNSIPDIENAGKCIALGQDTASVFHLMRAMECAVGELCTSLQIPNPDREWGKLLSDLHAKIGAMPKDKKRDAWSECHANLYHVKQAWRNSTMHPISTYSPEQSKDIFQCVRTFMNQLAILI
ncbi:hypothetical protein RPB_3477 [Rhodopseudomonas palustris HaA2]|uniref:DUF4145 domain-containing protein n=1 Tax=Rhodopseudomonas palustris (strain HaA2) TaxID=316058 RepID=Q2IUD8_RHOP2|nr:hypothetical protein [Rhodopseudomonas palustris]ABD08172.1 hypothetical protein RPB_3477 [Rhodopseudomonas palustris HaA2]